MMFDLEVVLAAASKHWKFCVYYILVGYVDRIIQGLTPPILLSPFLQDIAISAVVLVPAILIANKFVEITDLLELELFKAVAGFSLIAGLLAGRVGRLML